MNPVESQHPDYSENLLIWQLIADCCAGQKTIKAKGSTYLPVMEGVETTDKRYKNYVERANYVNITGRTKQGLVGAVFRRPPEINLPTGLEYLEDNADGSGESLSSLAKEATGAVIGKGRHILVVDYPSVERALTLEEEQRLKPQASIISYTAESLINWKTQVIAGHSVLSLLVFKEKYNASEDIFQHVMKDQYRVLSLDQDGKYVQSVYREGKIHDTFEPKANGNRLDYIPAVIVGSENNDPMVDMAPLQDIAQVNIAHYRNSADLEENCFVHGQLTLGVTSSQSNEQFKEANPNGIVVGAKAGHFLGERGGFTSVQAAENQLADKLMSRKEEQMKMLGARLIENQGQKTIAQTKMDATGENSVLATITENLSEAIWKCIQWCGEFMGTPVPEGTEQGFMLNSQFFDEETQPEVIMAAIQMSDRGMLAKSDVQNLARKQGLIPQDRTNEKIDGEAEVAPI